MCVCKQYKHVCAHACACIRECTDLLCACRSVEEKNAALLNLHGAVRAATNGDAMDHAVQVAYGQVRAVMLVMGEATPSARGVDHIGEGGDSCARMHRHHTSRCTHLLRC